MGILRWTPVAGIFIAVYEISVGYFDFIEKNKTIVFYLLYQGILTYFFLKYVLAL